MDKIAIACVFKTGGDFTTSDVAHLKTMVDSNVTIPYNFYCLTDCKQVIGCNIIPLVGGYSGWWSKIELFRPNLFEEERIVYFDLDTVIVDNIDDVLLQNYDLIGLRPFNPIKAKQSNYLASGMLSFRNGLFDYIYTEFNYHRYSRKYYGDQDYISDILLSKGFEFIHWQNIIDGIYSYKRNISQAPIKSFVDAKIVCFHGKPRPKDIPIKWLKDLQYEKDTRSSGRTR